MSRLFFVVLAALSLTAPGARAAVDIQEVISPGGITAWLVEEHQIPFVALEIRFKGGASLDAPGKRGAINLMTGLIEEGAGDLDARGFAQAQESLAARFEFDVYDDALSVSARFLTENRDASVALLKSALNAPRFDQDAVDRVRGQVLSIIRSDEKDPNEIARRAFNARTYGDHPYASSSNGTLESVGGLTRDDILAAHQAVLTKDKLFVGVVGDITAEELGALLDDLLGGLPETGAAIPDRAEISFDGGVEVVPFQTPQSVAIFGHAGISRDDPDFFPAFVLNTILGAGGFDSRLMTEVREKRGLTYGVNSYLASRDLADLVVGQVASANDRIAEAIDVIKAEWARIAAEGVTQDELEVAQTFLTGQYPLRFDGNARIAGILVGMQTGDLPIDYIATRNDKVWAVTLEDVRRVAARLLDPEMLTFVVVGAPEGLEATN
ncbi:Peptidase, M16 family [Candidatus Rhodobacter oscarellae]|uniref:Peptidase, M16 family n=1 Tax=Candidatus Rhodobacter oscarellae TaxID=1675527 RepID=A0A0J9H3E2_9RHOB|nr:pitrilysin family protein [Candidatus Rhodobacter lobularis]KMW60153.1 Peptidase, M16 family [Candidatus Rhodobacter lobularis]